MNNSRVLRRPAPSRGSDRKSESESSGKAKWLIFAALLLVFSALGAWAMSPGEDPQLAIVKELRAQAEAAPPEQRREMWGKLREEAEKLPEASREALFADRRQEWEARANKEMAEFFSKSNAEQIALIDKEIDRDEQRRAERAQRRAQAVAEGKAPGQGGRGGGGPGGGWGGRGGGRNNDPVARLQRSKARLDQTTPQSRAQRAEYQRMREERRKQRGLPT